MLDVIVSRGLPLDRITTSDVWATDTISACLPPVEEFKARMDELIWKKYRIEVEHPPCTHLSSSGQWAYKKGKDISLKYEGINFFMNFVNADCDKIAIENPVGIMSTEYKKPSQIIQPWQFGHKAQKSTCLWLKGLPLLIPTNIVDKGEFVEWIDKKTGRKKRQSKYDFEILKTAKTSEERSKLRSKTFEGIAEAMADQWGGNT